MPTLAKPGRNTDGLCECNNVESVQHMMFSCNRRRRERQQFYRVFRPGLPGLTSGFLTRSEVEE